MDVLELVQVLSWLLKLSTGSKPLDIALWSVGIIYVVYSIFINILVASYPKAKEQTWVQVSLAAVAHIGEIARKVWKKPEPKAELIEPPECPPTLRPPASLPPDNDV